MIFRLLDGLHALPGGRALLRWCYARRVPALPVEIMGLRLPNPVGLAAGLDKNARHARALAELGFGWLELGTVTPRPQPGNPRPRLLRLVRARALINRMGFNNDGVETFLANLRRYDRAGVIGINIGKNKDTPEDRAPEDYLAALRAVHTHADYVAVNVSSPNTPGLRALQAEAPLARLLAALKTEQDALARATGRYVPLALKIAPDLAIGEISAIARLARSHKFDAVIATNTTISRPAVHDDPHATEAGGLSGRPLKHLATNVIRQLYRELKGEIPIIGVGGIETADDAWDKLVAGADAVQIYTTLIYDGPAVIRRIVTGLALKVKASGNASLQQAIARARNNA